MRVFLGVTGASGAPYAARLLQALGGCGVRDRARRLRRRRRGDRDGALRRRDAAPRRGARTLRRRRPRPGHGLRDRRLQEPVRERLGEGRRLRRLSVLDEHGRHPRDGRDGEPDPSSRLGGPEGAPQARARSARDAAVVDPSAWSRDPARSGCGDPASRRRASTTVPRRSRISSTSSSPALSTRSASTTRSCRAGARRDARERNAAAGRSAHDVRPDRAGVRRDEPRHDGRARPAVATPRGRSRRPARLTGPRCLLRDGRSRDRRRAGGRHRHGPRLLGRDARPGAAEVDDGRVGAG